MLRLIGLAFCLLLAGAQDPADKVRALVEKLGSDEIAVREGAERDLEKIGFVAVPALKKVSESSVGELKLRLDRLIGKLTAYGRSIYVTIEAKDRPLRDIAADLEKQTGVPVSVVDAAGDFKASLSAKQGVLWKVVEDLCRDHAGLMYRFSEHGVELFAGKFRAMPKIDQGAFRFFIDRIAWDNQFLIHAGVLTPPGAKLIWMQVEVEELRDDKGINMAAIPEGRMYISQGGDRYGLNSRRIVFAQEYRPYAGPSFGASKISRFRGKAALMLAGGERLLARVDSPLSRTSTPAPEVLPTLGVDRWRLRDGFLTLDLTGGWSAESVKMLTGRLGPIMVFRMKNGDWLPPYSDYFIRTGPEEQKRRLMQVGLEYSGQPEIDSIDLVVPDPILKLEIPFDFKDIPLK